MSLVASNDRAATRRLRAGLRGRAMALGALLALSALSPGCALMSKSEPVTPRYFSAEAARATPGEGTTPGDGATPSAKSGPELRLGRVNAVAYLREKIVYRDSPFEVAAYEERRWTEKPEAYVRRALVHALFEMQNVQQIVSGFAVALDVDVLAFEQVRGEREVARVTLSYAVHDERAVRAARTVTVERPIAARGKDAHDVDGEAIARAMAEALEVAVDAVALATVAELRARGSVPSGGVASPSPPSPPSR